jgi:hypothetical protein
MENKLSEGIYNCHYDALMDASILLDHPKNPHLHPDRQIDALSHVIDLVGWRHPVVVSKDSGFIVYGHGRKLAAIKRGELVPVEYQSFGSEVEELAALMADNLIPELAEYSEDLKLSNLEELSELDFELEPMDAADDNGDESDPVIPDIEISDKIALERLTLFVEEHIKPDVLGQLRAISEKYDDGLIRIIT